MAYVRCKCVFHASSCVPRRHPPGFQSPPVSCSTHPTETPSDRAGGRRAAGRHERAGNSDAGVSAYSSITPGSTLKRGLIDRIERQLVEIDPFDFRHSPSSSEAGWSCETTGWQLGPLGDAVDDIVNDGGLLLRLFNASIASYNFSSRASTRRSASSCFRRSSITFNRVGASIARARCHRQSVPAR